MISDASIQFFYIVSTYLSLVYCIITLNNRVWNKVLRTFRDSISSSSIVTPCQYLHKCIINFELRTIKVMYYFEHKIMMLLQENGIFIAKNTNSYFFKVFLNFRKLKLFLLRESIMLRPKNRIENHFQLLMKNAILKVTIIFIADKIQCQGWQIS